MNQGTKELAREEPMSLVKVMRQGAITLPSEARKALSINEGDYLDVAVVGGEIHLKPVAVVDRRQIEEIRKAVEKADAGGPFVGHREAMEHLDALARGENPEAPKAHRVSR